VWCLAVVLVLSGKEEGDAFGRGLPSRRELTDGLNLSRSRLLAGRRPSRRGLLTQTKGPRRQSAAGPARGAPRKAAAPGFPKKKKKQRLAPAAAAKPGSSAAAPQPQAKQARARCGRRTREDAAQGGGPAPARVFEQRARRGGLPGSRLARTAVWRDAGTQMRTRAGPQGLAAVAGFCQSADGASLPGAPFRATGLGALESWCSLEHVFQGCVVSFARVK